MKVQLTRKSFKSHVTVIFMSCKSFISYFKSFVSHVQVILSLKDGQVFHGPVFMKEQQILPCLGLMMN